MRAVAMCVAAWSLALPHGARADGDAAKAKELFEQGRQLIDAADAMKDKTAAAAKIDTACGKFEQSVALDPQLGTRLNLADCRERQGKLVEAYALFAAAADAAHAAKEVREKFARDKLAQLAGKLVRVSVRVASPEPVGLTVKLGDRALSAAERGAVQVVAPGPIVVDASAPGYKPAHVEKTGEPGGELVVEVPALEAAEAAAPPPPVTSPHRSPVPLIVGGAGCGLVLTSIAIGLHAKSRYDSAYRAVDYAGVSSAQHEADAATVLAIVGGAAVAVGAVLYVRGRHDGDRVAIVPAAGPDGVGVAVAGGF